MEDSTTSLPILGEVDAKMFSGGLEIEFKSPQETSHVAETYTHIAELEDSTTSLPIFEEVTAKATLRGHENEDKSLQSRDPDQEKKLMDLRMLRRAQRKSKSRSCFSVFYIFYVISMALMLTHVIESVMDSSLLSAIYSPEPTALDKLLTGKYAESLGDRKVSEAIMDYNGTSSSILMSMLSVENAWLVRIVAESYADKSLKEAADNFLWEHREETVDSKTWNDRFEKKILSVHSTLATKSIQNVRSVSSWGHRLVRDIRKMLTAVQDNVNSLGKAFQNLNKIIRLV